MAYYTASKVKTQGYQLNHTVVLDTCGLGGDGCCGPALALDFQIQYSNKHSRLRGGRQGAAAPHAPPARDFVRSNPDLMHEYAKSLMYMLMGRMKRQFLLPGFGIP